MIFNKPLLIAFGISAALLIAGSYALKMEISAHAQTKLKLTVAESALDSYIQATTKIVEDQVVISAKSLDYQNKYSEASRELNNLKGREALILKKRSLVELRINKAFNKQQSKYACITGDKTSCGN